MKWNKCYLLKYWTTRQQCPVGNPQQLSEEKGRNIKIQLPRTLTYENKINLSLKLEKNIYRRKELSTNQKHKKKNWKNILWSQKSVLKKTTHTNKSLDGLSQKEYELSTSKVILILLILSNNKVIHKSMASYMASYIKQTHFLGVIKFQSSLKVTDSQKRLNRKNRQLKTLSK